MKDIQGFIRWKMYQIRKLLHAAQFIFIVIIIFLLSTFALVKGSILFAERVNMAYPWILHETAYTFVADMMPSPITFW